LKKNSFVEFVCFLKKKAQVIAVSSPANAVDFSRG